MYYCYCDGGLYLICKRAGAWYPICPYMRFEVLRDDELRRYIEDERPRPRKTRGGKRARRRKAAQLRVFYEINRLLPEDLGASTSCSSVRFPEVASEFLEILKASGEAGTSQPDAVNEAEPGQSGLIEQASTTNGAENNQPAGVEDEADGAGFGGVQDEKTGRKKPTITEDGQQPGGSQPYKGKKNGGAKNAQSGKGKTKNTTNGAENNQPAGMEDEADGAGLGGVQDEKVGGEAGTSQPNAVNEADPDPTDQEKETSINDGAKKEQLAAEEGAVGGALVGAPPKKTGRKKPTITEDGQQPGGSQPYKGKKNGGAKNAQSGKGKTKKVPQKPKAYRKGSSKKK